MFTTDPCGAAGGPVSDDFHSTTLNTSLWTVVNPLGDGTVSLNGTHAVLTVPPTITHDGWMSGDQKLRIMQAINDVDFEVEAKFDSPRFKFPDQAEGIIVENNSANYMRFEFIHDCNDTYIFAATIANNVPNAIIQTIIPDGSPSRWLRVRRVGSTWTESWSTDGLNYTVATTFTYALTVTKIGPAVTNSAINGNPAPAFTSYVDYFFNAASPIVPQDGVSASPQVGPMINVWYGDNQTFGQNGIPQEWVNIMGNVSSPRGVASLTYSLNGGAQQALAVPPNTNPVPSPRLAEPGDFNAEIDYTSLNPGTNTVVLTATDNAGNTSQHTVTIHYVSGQTWPSTYSVNWSTAPSIQSVVQPVDGNWQIQSDGTVRTVDPGYDRLLDLGDVNTWSDYVVTTQVTIYAVDSCSYGWGVGLISGWKGATTSNDGVIAPDQPRSGHTFDGACGYGAVQAPSVAPYTFLYTNTPAAWETILADQNGSPVPLTLGVAYMFKFQVQKNGSGGSTYSMKVWQVGTSEPAAWNLQANGPLSQGSLLLWAYMCDVSFGQVNVTALP
jgi:hypothetical protein